MSQPQLVSNPFIYGQILLPGRPFCPRPALEAAVLQAANDNARIVLLGDRRMGKSSLAEQTLGVGHRILIPVDLRGLNSVDDFIDRLLLRLATKLDEHRALLKHLPASLREALAFVSDLRVSIGGMVEIQAKAKVKASTVIQAMNAVERASQWRPLVVFFDEFQEIAENLEENEARHLLGVLRGEIQRQQQVAYVFAGSARSSMFEMFTAETSHFYQSATILDVGSIPRDDMAAFLEAQFARGGRKLGGDTMQAIFALAGHSPSDQQQFAYHLWTQSTPEHIGLPELRRAFAALMAEVGRRGEVLLDEATPAQRRALFAVAVREDEEFARDSFLRFAGFRQHSSLTSALRAFQKGNSAILEKRGTKMRYRERFMRLWMLLQVMRNPSMFPAARNIQVDTEYSLLLPYLADALK
jgi:hypothetical protein